MGSERNDGNIHLNEACVSRREPEQLRMDDFITGLLAALVCQGRAQVSLRDGCFDRTVARLCEEISRTGRFCLRFRVRPHLTYGDSLALQSALLRAAQRGLISFTGHQDITIRLGVGEAKDMLADITGSRNLYLKLADMLISENSC